MITEIEVREKPILFSGDMVRAILAGRKTQTRRVVKGVGNDNCMPWGNVVTHVLDAPERGLCPYGAVGDRLWVRETWALEDCGNRVSLAPEAWPNGWPIERLRYPATEQREHWWNLRPSIHMPRWASRINLEITGVRVELLQNISEHDGLAEGIEPPAERFPSWGMGGGTEAEARAQDRWIAKYGRNPIQAAYRNLWDSLNAKRGFGWDVNPWVWVIEFKRDAQAQPATGSRE